MSIDCKWIPEKNGVPSKLFSDLNSILRNRGRAIELYSMFSQKEIQNITGISRLDSNGEPYVEDVLSVLGDPKKLLKNESYIKYIIKKEKLNSENSSFTNIYEKFNSLREKYPDLSFDISKEIKGFRINILSNNDGNLRTRDIIFKGELQNKLLKYLNLLGFDINRNSTVDNISRFSPLEAEQNAETLKKIISLAKGEKGETDFIEEFSHLIIEGLHKHPLVIRLLNTLDDAAVKEILEDLYEQYKETYKNDYLLKKEAAGKLLAEALFNDNLNAVQKRIVNHSLENFAKGSTSEIDNIIEEAKDIANNLAEVLDDSTTIEIFDTDAVLNASTLYSLDKEVTELKKLSDKAYEILNKKLKIISSRNRLKKESNTEDAVIKKMKVLMQNKQYAGSNFAFLDYVIKDMNELYSSINKHKEKFKNNKKINLNHINNAFKLLRKISTSIAAYSDVIDDMAAIKSIEGIENELSKEDIENIVEKASEIKVLISDITNMYEKARFNTIFKFFEYYWGDSKIITSMSEKGEVSLEDVMNLAPADISGISRLFNSMEDASDPLLTIVDSIFKKVYHKRDAIIFEYVQEIKSIHEEYVRATGSRDTSFMYVFDENGVPTGMMISNRDYTKFYKAQREEIDRLKKEGLSNEEIREKLEVWKLNNTEPVEVSPNRIERLPKLKLYESDALSKLTPAQRTYYDKMVAVKKRVDDVLPSKYIRTDRAPQKKASTSDAILRRFKNPKAAIKQIYGSIKKGFISSIDDTEFGTKVIDEEESKAINKYGEVIDGPRQRQILLDFAGNPVSRVPVYYSARLENMNYLSTDFTDSFIAYVGSIINYDQIEKIADAMEVVKEFAKDRKVTQTAGRKILHERFKSKDKEVFENVYTKKGGIIADALEKHIDANLYSKRKEEEKFYVGDVEINYGKAGDKLKTYSTLLNMGYNLFSTASNLTMGNSQLFLEGLANLSDPDAAFNIKDLAAGSKYYFSHLPKNFIGQFDDVKKDALTLLLQKFDSTEDFFNSTKNENSSRNAFQKSLSLISPLSGMSAGEHYLHGVLLTACLNHVKVKVNSEETTLLKAFTVSEEKTKSGTTIYKLVLPENVTFLDGKKVTEEDLLKIKRKFQATSHAINGAYSDIDKGQINNKVIGRLLSQYRQWMPAFFMSRFKSKRYNDAFQRDEEGYYLTFARFILGYFKNVKESKFKIATNWNRLSDYQKRNVLRATYEMVFLFALSLVLKALGNPDKDDPYAANFLRYLGHRLRLEVGSGVPLNIEFFNNLTTLIKSPIPSLQSLTYLTNLLNVTDVFDTLQTGKYEGWNKWVRNAYLATPFLKNVGRQIDLANDKFDMFNMYLKN